MHLRIDSNYHLVYEPEMIRTFWPVGQGLFCSERFTDPADNTTAVVVYDCGSTREILWNSIEKKFMPQNYGKIDLLFISHFHVDHISGIPYLLQNYDIRNILLPVITTSLLAESYIYNALYSTTSSTANNLLIGFAQRSIGSDSNLVSVSSIPDIESVVNGDNGVDSRALGKSLKCGKVIRLNDWIYIPFNHIESDSLRAFGEDLKSSFPTLYEVFANIERHDESEIQELVKGIGLSKLEELYRRHYKDLNRSSMTVYSAPSDLWQKRNAACLYTGDYPMRDNVFLKDILSFYHHYLHTIGLLQVPHHGSNADNPGDLFRALRPNTCVISAGENNIYRHPGKQTLLNIINSRSEVKIVTDKAESSYYEAYSRLI